MVRAGFPGRLGPVGSRGRRGGVVVPISPAQLAGTRGWWRLQDASTVIRDGSNKVSQVNDKSGNGFNLLQPTSSIQPIYDPVRGTIASLTGEGKMTVPGISGSLTWGLFVVRINPARLAAADGSIFSVNNSQRTPFVGYDSSASVLRMQWNSSGGAQANTITFAPGVDFTANTYVSVFGYFESGVFKASVNGGTLKTQGSGLLNTSVSSAGWVGDLRAGWTDSGLSEAAVGTDNLTPEYVAGLIAYGQIQAAIANAP